MFGKDVGVTIYISISGLLILLYTMLIISYFVVMVKIMRMLKQGFNDLYNESKIKLFSALLVFQLCLTFRVYLFFNFYFRQMAEIAKIIIESEVYEILIIGIICYVSYRNSKQNDEEMEEFERHILPYGSTNNESFLKNSVMN